MKTTQNNSAGVKAGGGGYLAKKEVAERLGVTERTIDLWRRERGLPWYKPTGRVYFVGEEVEAWVKRGGIQKSEVGSQKTEDGRQKSEGGRGKSESGRRSADGERRHRRSTP
jgi:excisionase family DNA binding protein